MARQRTGRVAAGALHAGALPDPAVALRGLRRAGVVAMACARRIISTGGALPEVGGDACLSFDPPDTAAFATCLERIAGDRTRRGRRAGCARTAVPRQFDLARARRGDLPRTAGMTPVAHRPPNVPCAPARAARARCAATAADECAAPHPRAAGDHLAGRWRRVARGAARAAPGRASLRRRAGVRARLPSRRLLDIAHTVLRWQRGPARSRSAAARSTCGSCCATGATTSCTRTVHSPGRWRARWHGLPGCRTSCSPCTRSPRTGCSRH